MNDPVVPADQPANLPVQPTAETPAPAPPVLDEAAKAAALKERARNERILVYSFLMEAEGAYSKGGALLARRDENAPWQSLGFFSNKEGMLLAKLGDHAAQPIGYDDGDGFYPNSEAKLLWTYDFALSQIVPIQPPYVVVKSETPTDIDNAAKLTEVERGGFTAAFHDLSQELQRLLDMGVSTTNLDARKEQQDKLRFAITYWSVQPACRLFNVRLRQLVEQNPELKHDLSGVDEASLPKVASSCTEYLRMKLNDDGVRRFLGSHEIQAIPTEGRIEHLVSTTLDALQTLAAVDPPDLPVIKKTLENAMHCFPFVSQALVAYRDTPDIIPALNAAITCLQQKVSEIGPTKAAA